MLTEIPRILEFDVHMVKLTVKEGENTDESEWCVALFSQTSTPSDFGVNP